MLVNHGYRTSPFVDIRSVKSNGDKPTVDPPGKSLSDTGAVSHIARYSVLKYGPLGA